MDRGEYIRGWIIRIKAEAIGMIVSDPRNQFDSGIPVSTRCCRDKQRCFEDERTATRLAARISMRLFIDETVYSTRTVYYRNREVCSTKISVSMLLVFRLSIHIRPRRSFDVLDPDSPFHFGIFPTFRSQFSSHDLP